MKKIDRQVEKYNGSEWRREQMTLSGYVKDRERRARKEGEAEASRRIAAKMKASGMASAEIAEMTGLSEEEIEEL